MTDAIERAARVVADRAWWTLAAPVPPQSLARAVLSAALDADEIAQAIHEGDCGCTDDTAPDDEDPSYTRMAESVRAALLGEADE